MIAIKNFKGHPVNFKYDMLYVKHAKDLLIFPPKKTEHGEEAVQFCSILQGRISRPTQGVLYWLPLSVCESGCLFARDNQKSCRTTKNNDVDVRQKLQPCRPWDSR